MVPLAAGFVVLVRFPSNIGRVWYWRMLVAATGFYAGLPAKRMRTAARLYGSRELSARFPAGRKLCEARKTLHGDRRSGGKRECLGKVIAAVLAILGVS